MSIEPAPSAVDCKICAQNLEFDIPTNLLEKLLSGHVALFAGAGVSQEISGKNAPTFYSSIAKSLGIDTGPPFPEVME